jgi:hypothetical protein
MKMHGQHSSNLPRTLHAIKSTKHAAAFVMFQRTATANARAVYCQLQCICAWHHVLHLRLLKRCHCDSNSLHLLTEPHQWVIKLQPDTTITLLLLLLGGSVLLVYREAPIAQECHKVYTS